MARRRKNSESDVIWLIVVFGIIAFFVIKWILTLLVFVIAVIIAIIAALIKSHQEKQKSKEAKPFSASTNTEMPPVEKQMPYSSNTEVSSLPNDLNTQIVQEISKLESLIREADEIYQKNKDREWICLEPTYRDLAEYKEKLQGYNDIKSIHLSKNISENILEEIEDDIDWVQMIVDDLNDEVEDYEEEQEMEEEENIATGAATLLAGGALLHMMNEDKKRKEEQKLQEERESLKSVWNLSDEEADLVQEGRYNPWNFGNDKEELEDGDYHYEYDV